MSPGQRHQHRRRQHHQLDHADLHRHRSPSPTRSWCPLAGQTAIIDVGIAVLINGTAPDLLRPEPAPRQPEQLRPVHPPERGHRADRRQRQLLGHHRRRRGQHRAGHQHHRRCPTCSRSTTSGRTASCRRCPATTAGSTWPGPGSSTRAATSPTPTIPMPSCRSSWTPRPPRPQFVSPTAGQVITSLTNGDDPVHDHDQREHRPDPLHGRVDPGHQRRPRRHPRARPTTSPIPINPDSIHGHAPRPGDRRHGPRADHRSRRTGTLTNNLYQVTLLNTGTDAVRDIAGNTWPRPSASSSRSPIPSLATDLFVGAAVVRHRPDRHARARGRTRTRPSAPR